MNVANRIVQLRLQQEKSQCKLAKNSGLSQAGLSAIESGKKQPTVETVYKICSALGITIFDFFSDNQEPEPLPPELKRFIELSRQLHPTQLEVFTELLEALVEKNNSTLKENDYGKSIKPNP